MSVGDEHERARLLVVDEFLAWAMLRGVRLCQFSSTCLLGHYTPLDNREMQQLAEKYFEAPHATAKAAGGGE